MTNKITQIPFRGTPEQEAKLKEVIAAHKGHSDAMMPVLQQAQEIYGYLPIEVQTMIAEGLGVSLEQVYGVSTFYSWFTLEPKGEHLIRVCLGTACYVKGSADILAELERQLGIKEFSVREHVSAIMAKFNASNRAEAVAIAFRKHLLNQA